MVGAFLMPERASRQAGAHPDTGVVTMSESTPEASTSTQAAQMVADAVASARPSAQSQPTQAPQEPSPAAAQPAADAESEPKDWETEATKWRTLARRHEGKHLDALGFKSKGELDQLREAAGKYQEVQDAQKTEIQKATERAQTVEQQLADMRATNARLMAAATHSIPPDLIDLLGSGTDEEISARAEMLAERLKASQPAPAPAAQRPVEALTPGAAPASSTATASPDEWIRRMSGRST